VGVGVGVGVGVARLLRSERRKRSGAGENGGPVESNPSGGKVGKGQAQAALFIRLPSAVASLFHVGWAGRRGRAAALPVDAL